jgi:FKBP-type peptidyl-prolyl cis-trans isomerase 2
MKKIVLLVSLFALTACMKPSAPAPTPTETPTPQTQGEAPVKNAVVKLNYTLREGKADGKILETTIESIAKENGLYASGTKYEPFSVVLGTNSVIPGFEKGITGMKAGEKKVIEVSPKDGYGEARITRETNKYEIAPEFTLENIDKTRFQDVITQVVQKAQLGDAGKDLKEGQSLTGGLGIVAKVMKIDGENITLEIPNKDHPFYGKKLAVGASATKDGATFTVKSISESGVTLDVKNSRSPFAGKAFAPGATATVTGQTSTEQVEIKIVSLSGNTVTLDMPNPHPLGGKTLFFDIEVLSVE